jgi:phytoene synthase
LPRALRPLTVLAGLALRSLARGGAPLLDGAGATLLAVRLGIAGR